MATHTFDLLTKPRIPTRMGEGGARNSTIDLVWRNLAAQIQGTFVGAEVNFGTSAGSDHALIRTIAFTPVPVYRAKVDRTDRFDTDISAEEWEEWGRLLRFHLPPLTPLHNPDQVDSAVDAIYTAFNEACKATMKTVGSALGFNLRWWNDECKAAALVLRSVGRSVRRGRWGVCPECRQGVEEVCRAISKQVQRSDAGIEVVVMHTGNELKYRALDKGLYDKRMYCRALDKGLQERREGVQGLDK
jgi:hypothetical protein